MAFHEEAVIARLVLHVYKIACAVVDHLDHDPVCTVVIVFGATKRVHTHACSLLQRRRHRNIIRLDADNLRRTAIGLLELNLVSIAIVAVDEPERPIEMSRAN
eukprot:5665726-Pleurochrysis_carterae.AAC.2